MNRVGTKSTEHFKTKMKEKLTCCANCCQLVHHNESLQHFTLQVKNSTSSTNKQNIVEIKTAVNTIYNLNYTKKSQPQYDPVVVMCERCFPILVNLFKFYSQFNGLRQVNSYLGKEIQNLDFLLQQLESPNNHPTKSQEDDDASGGENANLDVDDDDVKMEISSTEEVNSDSDEDYHPSDQADPNFDVTQPESLKLEDEDDTSCSDSDDPLKIEEDEVTREQESTSTIISCQGSKSDLLLTIQSEFTKHFVRVQKEKKVQNNTVIDPVTRQEEHDVTQPSKKDLNLDRKKCLKRFRSLKNSQIHQKYCKVSKDDLTALDTKECQCTVPGCNKILIGSKELKAHQKAAHFVFIGDKVTCTICQMSLQKRCWSSHVKTHEESRSRCPKCFLPTTKIELEIHVQGCKGLKTYSCDICGLNNVSYSTLQRHMVEHTGKYFCCPKPNCDKKFKIEYHLRYHIRHHDLSNQFNCPDPTCAKFFKVKKSLANHILVTHPHLVSSIQAENHLCPVCGVSVLGSDRLKMHMRSHREAAFQCHVCPKAFKVKQHLDHHLARHEGKRTVPCTFEGCSKLFYREHEVRNHMRTHTGEKNHLCPICGRASSDAGNLRKHMLIHSEVKQFKCHLCDKAYKQPQMLKTHLKTHQI